MSLLHNIMAAIFGALESKQERYYRECEEAFRQSQQEHDDADISSKQH